MDEATVKGRREAERGCSQKCLLFLFYLVDALALPKVNVGARPRPVSFGMPPHSPSGVRTPPWMADVARTALAVPEPTTRRWHVIPAGATPRSTARTPGRGQSDLKPPQASAAWKAKAQAVAAAAAAAAECLFFTPPAGREGSRACVAAGVGELALLRAVRSRTLDPTLRPHLVCLCVFSHETETLVGGGLGRPRSWT